MTLRTLLQRFVRPRACLVVALLLTWTAGAAVLAAEPTKGAASRSGAAIPKASPTPGARSAIDPEVAALKLRGLYYNSFQLGDVLAAAPRGALLIFAGPTCPIVKRYVPTINALAADYRPQGLDVLLVFPEPHLTCYEMSSFALETGLTPRCVQDIDQRLVKHFHVERIGHAIVLDGQGRVVYSGAIDDQFTYAGGKTAATKPYVRDALDALLRGAAPSEATTPVHGCPLSLSAAKRSRPAPPSFVGEVWPILERKCVTCHNVGGAGMAFASFESPAAIQDHREVIRDVVLDGRMPPARNLFNPERLKVRDEKGLTSEERALVVAWIDAGAPLDGAIPPRPTAAPPRWRIGAPDMSWEMDKPFVVPATGRLDYQFFRFRVNAPNDKWVRAVEVAPGNPSVVHHIDVHVVPADDFDYSGPGAMARIYGITAEGSTMLGSYVPGDDTESARVFPAGYAMKLPRRHDLVLEVHYTPSGKVTTDRSRVGLLLQPQRPAHEMFSHSFRFPREKLKIPAYSAHFTGEREIWFKQDVHIWSLRAHMHRVGKSWRLDWVHTKDFSRPDPGQLRQFLLGNPAWDFNWQISTDLEQPLEVPAGQPLVMSAAWDNSAFNPSNLDPERPKQWGIQTEDEMFSVRMRFSPVNPRDDWTLRDLTP